MSIDTMPTVATVGVFSGARPHPVFCPLAEALGRTLAEHEIGLVNGSGDCGLMGAVSKGAHEAGGAVTGVVPSDLFLNERTGPPRGELLLVRDMHERQRLMYRLSQGFIVLPGGLGTATELFEAATWSQIGIHEHHPRKPVVVLNWGGYYDPLGQQLTDAVEHGFLTEPERELVHFAADATEALRALGIPSREASPPRPAPPVRRVLKQAEAAVEGQVEGQVEESAAQGARRLTETTPVSVRARAARQTTRGSSGAPSARTPNKPEGGES